MDDGADEYAWMETKPGAPKNKETVDWAEEACESYSVIRVILSWSLTANGAGLRLYGDQTMRMHGICARVSREWMLSANASRYWVNLGIAFGFEGPSMQVKSIVGGCVAPLHRLNQRTNHELTELRGEAAPGRPSKIKICVMGAEKELGIQLAYRLANVKLEAERPLWESARFVPASETWRCGVRSGGNVEAVLWWEFRDAAEDWTEGADAVVIAHANDSNPGQMRQDILTVQENLRKSGCYTGTFYKSLNSNPIPNPNPNPNPKPIPNPIPNPP